MDQSFDSQFIGREIISTSTKDFRIKIGEYFGQIFYQDLVLLVQNHGKSKVGVFKPSVFPENLETVSITTLRNQMARYINKVFFTKQDIVVEKNGKPIAIIRNFNSMF